MNFLLFQTVSPFLGTHHQAEGCRAHSCSVTYQTAGYSRSVRPEPLCCLLMSPESTVSSLPVAQLQTHRQQRQNVQFVFFLLPCREKRSCTFKTDSLWEQIHKAHLPLRFASRMKYCLKLKYLSLERYTWELLQWLRTSAFPLNVMYRELIRQVFGHFQRDLTSNDIVVGKRVALVDWVIGNF